MLLHDAVGNREPQAGAAPHGLGREERLEDVRQRVRRDAGAVVDHLGVHLAAVAGNVRGHHDAPTGLGLEHGLLGVQ